MPPIRKIKLCVDCGKLLDRITVTRCRPCFGKYKSIIQMREGNPHYKNGKYSNFGVSKCIDCGCEVLGWSKRCPACRGKTYTGANNPKWKGGRGKFPYPDGWRESLKKSIRERDNYKCQECGVPQEECVRSLHVHHIDMNKENLDPTNLISLCAKCHSKTHSKEVFHVVR